MKKADIEKIQERIIILRKIKVMLDSDLAELYGVETKALNRAVKRNLDRFPGDFMFQLSKKEFEDLRYHFGTANSYSKRRTLPYAFTQNGIAMLSSVLGSEQAIRVNINIMRVFTKTSELLRNQAEIYKKIEKIEKQGGKNSEDIQMIFQAIKELYGFKEDSEKKKKKLGFE